MPVNGALTAWGGPRSHPLTVVHQDAVTGHDGGMTLEQAYVVLAERGPLEVRRYAPCTVADVTVRGDAERAAFSGFRPLVTYISAANLAMTAPVLQEPARQPHAGEPAWTVSFVLPPGGDYPMPADSRVHLREVPEHTAAAIRFSGRWSDSSVRRHTEELMAAVTAYGWQPVGAPRWARFDPPWKPWFLRRNEVVVEVVGAP